MKTVNIHEAKTHLSRLIARAEDGEEVVIARAGRPVAKLVGVQRSGKRPLGTARGKIVVRGDLKAPLPKYLRRAFGM